MVLNMIWRIKKNEKEICPALRNRMYFILSLFKRIKENAADSEEICSLDEFRLRLLTRLSENKYSMTC